MGAVFRLRAGKVVLSENDIEKQITDYLVWLGWTPVRLHVGAFVPWSKAKTLIDLLEAGTTGAKLDRARSDFNRAVVRLNEEGTTDWLFVHAHYPAIWLEVKRPGKKPTPAQARFMEHRQVLRQLASWTSDLTEFKDWYLKTVIRRATAF